MASCPRCGGRMETRDAACRHCGFRFAEDPVGDFLGSIPNQADEPPGDEATDSTDLPQKTHEKLIDWMGVGVSAQENPDLFWRTQQQSREAHLQRERNLRRMKRFRFLAIIAVLVGAALGVTVDDTMFGVPADAFPERITGALLVGAFFSFVTYLLTLRLAGFVMAAFVSSQTVYYDQENASPKRELDPLELASWLALVAAVPFSTYIAAGARRANVHSYICSLASEGLLLAAVWLVYRWRNQTDKVADGTVE